MFFTGLLNASRQAWQSTPRKSPNPRVGSRGGKINYFLLQSKPSQHGSLWSALIAAKGRDGSNRVTESHQKRIHLLSHFCFFGSLQIERLSGGHQLATRSRSLFFRGSGTDCFNVAPCHLFKSETFHISTKLLSCRSPRALLPGGVVPLSPYTIRL